MRVCPHCAAHLPAEEFVCRSCGGRVTELIQPLASDEPSQIDEPRSLTPTRRNLDVTAPAPTRWVEYGFVLGCFALGCVSLYWFSGWWTDNREDLLVGAIVLLISTPLAGLFGGIVAGNSRSLLTWALTWMQKEGTLPQLSALARTNSLAGDSNHASEGRGEFIAPSASALPGGAVTKANSHLREP